MRSACSRLSWKRLRKFWLLFWRSEIKKFHSSIRLMVRHPDVSFDVYQQVSQPVSDPIWLDISRLRTVVMILDPSRRMSELFLSNEYNTCPGSVLYDRQKHINIWVLSSVMYRENNHLHNNSAIRQPTQMKDFLSTMSQTI